MIQHLATPFMFAALSRRQSEPDKTNQKICEIRNTLRRQDLAVPNANGSGSITSKESAISQLEVVEKTAVARVQDSWRSKDIARLMFLSELVTTC